MFIVGLPLTLLQFGTHRLNPAVTIDFPIVATNLLLAHAIYDADRIAESPSFPSVRLPWNVNETKEPAGEKEPGPLAPIDALWPPCPTVTTHAAALLACARLATTTSPAIATFLVPLVLALHLAYPQIKTAVAPVKPFFVAGTWTIGVYCLPLWTADVPVDAMLRHDPFTPAALFLSLVSLSHLADVRDIDEDVADGVLTPAARMGTAEATCYAAACALASSLLHAHAPSPFTPYDAVALSVFAGVLLESATLSAALSVALLLAYADAHNVEILTWLLRQTEWSHKWALSTCLNVAERALEFPEPIRSAVVEKVVTLMRDGDRVGAAILQMYHDVLRDRLAEMSAPPPWPPH